MASDNQDNLLGIDTGGDIGEGLKKAPDIRPGDIFDQVTQTVTSMVDEVVNPGTTEDDEPNR